MAGNVVKEDVINKESFNVFVCLFDWKTDVQSVSYLQELVFPKAYLHPSPGV